MAKKEPGWWWAQVSLVIGIGISIYGNVQHTLVVQKHFGGGIVFAVAWPVLVFLSIEMMAKARWRQGVGWALARYLGLGSIALVCAVASYDHLAALLAGYGEDTLVAHLGPLAPDGLMILATTALLGMGRKQPAESAVEALADAPEGYAVAPEPVAALEPTEPRQLSVPRSRKADQAKRDRARQSYVESVAAGTPLTGTELGKRYRRSRQWADAIIREAKAA